MKEEITVCI